ncbi:MAG: monovalent cation/H(+) antiporter subunit G [Eubacteriales bacterium]|nr:monovalent cation/H(+) antiporter subunit G [Eubacteriales bacterium]
MILAWIRFGLAALCMLGGLFVIAVSIIGLFRFDFALNRIHASAMSDTLGLILILLGVMIAIGFHAVAWKLLLILILQWCTSPLCSHMLSRLEYCANENLAQYEDLTDAEYREEDTP